MVTVFGVNGGYRLRVGIDAERYAGKTEGTAGGLLKGLLAKAVLDER